MTGDGCDFFSRDALFIVSLAGKPTLFRMKKPKII
jgi:hypothetical protein